MPIIKASERVNPNRSVGGVQKTSARFPVLSTLLTPANMGKPPAIWFDAMNAPALVGNNITQINDESGNNRHSIVTNGADQLTYEASNTLHGGPAFIHAKTSRLGSFGTLDWRHMFLLISYVDGVQSTFSDFVALIINETTLPRVMTNSGANNFNSQPLTMRKTGAVVDVANGPLLPWNKDIIHISVNVNSTSTSLLNYSSGLARGHEGPFSELIFYDVDLTSTEIEQIEGYLSHKWGKTLASGHPFENAAPTV